MTIQLIYFNLKYLRLYYINLAFEYETLQSALRYNYVSNIFGNCPILFVTINNLIFLKK